MISFFFSIARNQPLPKIHRNYGEVVDTGMIMTKKQGMKNPLIFPPPIDSILHILQGSVEPMIEMQDNAREERHRRSRVRSVSRSSGTKTRKLLDSSLITPPWSPDGESRSRRGYRVILSFFRAHWGTEQIGGNTPGSFERECKLRQKVQKANQAEQSLRL
jgi:hypothetical protein